jgi:oligopeptide transport system permease protein
MGKVIAWRIVQFPFILAIIYVITFLLAWVAPGDPFSGERKLDPIVEQTLREKYHAGSAWQFLGYYPIKMLQGDFGPSLIYKEWGVHEIILTSLPISVALGTCALVIGVIAGVSIGTLAAVNRGGVLDWASLTLALVGISIPSFVMAALMLITSSAPAFQGLFAIGQFNKPSDAILPALALSLSPMAYIARLTRVSMLDVLGSDFVRTAKAKGVSKTWIIWKHCLKNAFLPVLSYLGPAAAVTLTGSFVVEKVFNIPGLGQHFVNSVMNRDQPLILGVVMVYSLFLLSFNLIVDIAYSLIDPRIDLSAKAAG